MNKELGHRIKELRTARNITQEQIAEQIGISRQKYARIESGVNSDITRVLDDVPAVAYRSGQRVDSSEKMFDMLDLFYANKHLSTKLQHRNMV